MWWNLNLMFEDRRVEGQELDPGISDLSSCHPGLVDWISQPCLPLASSTSHSSSAHASFGRLR
jgi:hypothetical protein